MAGRAAHRRTPWARIVARDRFELRLLVGALGVTLLALLFLQLAGAVLRGDTQALDERILRALRRPDDPAVPIGPLWLRIAALDATAIGSATVLGLAAAAIAGYMLLHGMVRHAAFVLTASAGGWVLDAVLKELFERPRPAVVPHLREVATLSFPSGHALTSAAVYLTLGALVMSTTRSRPGKIYCMTVAMLATAVAGASRVYLGVHYPTDVLAGWLVGLSWALLCWMALRGLERRAGLHRERSAGT